MVISESDLEDLLLNLMNASRNANGIPTAYTRDATFDAGARTHTQLVISKAMVATAPLAAVCPAQIDIPVRTWVEKWDPDHWCPGEEMSPIERIQPNWQTLHGIRPGENVGNGNWISPGVQKDWDPPYEDILRSIHSGFMNENPPEDGHKRAILNPDYNTIGIGVQVFTHEKPPIQQEAYLRFTVDFAKV